ncbi:type II toxin-antitoxin system HicB family antitoxin [Serratia marcescens]|uniref:type II toxin-antitoxin system HicB family antitoxin n=1 Tax=Serratia marcescens TaxID=615 RepID=UPI002875A4A8|nr:type II toxin-antitoxin system HicB family antitoxin [Serratia marcescens]MDS0826037.1 type II toxin-antitoxin system HicB family antitoxin [Serratia marcescens]
MTTKTAAATPNTMEIAGQPAIISYVPEIGAFRGKFLGLSGYCDFVSDSIQGLKAEGEISLREYLEDCSAAGIEPYARQEKIKTFTLRYPESFGERLNQAAAENEVSVNAFIVETLNERMKHA